MPAGQSRRLRNVPEESRPFGRARFLAYLPAAREEVETLSGAKFILGEDDLGPNYLAICEVEGLPVFGMEQRDHPEHSGVSLFVDATAPHPDGWPALTW